VTTDARTRIATLVTLVAVLAAVVAWQFWPGAASAPSPVAAQRSNPAGAAGGADPGSLDVNLAALQREGVAQQATGRDPFGFRAAAPPPPPAGGSAVRPPPPAGEPPPEASGPPPPPPPPPITLKFIGLIVDGPGQRKIAVLSDGKFVFHGREGDIIEGRFRVVRIGDESMQMEHIDGRGRQTIRLSGS
jgi:hypothetical protein